jgi:phosphoribosylaminoimidazole-succinocarboxamide synthase
MQLADEFEMDAMTSMAYRVTDFLTGLFSMMQIQLIDFKIEFGRLNSVGGFHEVILADEISPDNCRLWDMKTNEKLDKDRFRRDLGGLIESYTDIANRMSLKLPELKAEL